MKTPAEAPSPTRASSQPAPTESPLQRYLPLLLWFLVIVTLLAIPMRIIGYGYLPGGDARRHVAKAFTDKPYNQILLLRSEYSMDHSPGWEWLLKVLHQKAGWNLDALVTFSVVGLMLCVFYAPLPWLRRPEAWLAALLAQMLAIPELMTRLTQARPLLITEGILIAILFAWSKPSPKNPSWLKLTLTCLGISLSVWMHGAWYLWVLPLAAFFLARSWRKALWLTACFVAGILAGALFTGKPIEFLRQALLIVAAISREHLPQWMLVGELRPSYGEFETLLLLAVVVIWRKLQSIYPAGNTAASVSLSPRERAGVRGNTIPYNQESTDTSGNENQNHQQPDLLRQPIFWLILICWILGFKADRFWADWGVPAVLVWLTLQFEDLMPTLWDAASPKRLMVCGLLAMPLFLHTTNDLDRRYTFNLNENFLNASDPSLQGWLPEGKGIFYSAQMGFFYNTFYQNPQAEWRYIVGLEPALMPEEDRQIFRQIQWNNYAFKAYEPWINKMLSADRLMLEHPVQPNLPQLEWHNALGNIWIGRLPKLKNP